MGKSYELLMEWKKKYPKTVTWWRLRKHCDVIDKHLNPGEEVKYILAGQLDDNAFSFFNTGVMAITNERLIIAQNRLIVGYLFSSITPDLYNDLQVSTGLFWGTLTVDTVKEKIFISDLDKRCLPEVETSISMFMQESKKKYLKRENEN